MPSADVSGIMTELRAMRGKSVRTLSGWSPSVVFTHLAQSTEYSMTGFPSLKSETFRATAGRAAFFAFSTAGAMRHGLTDPIPGAPSIDHDDNPVPALDRLLLALETFEAYTGELAPHFAYGELAKPDYAHAHVLHIRDHLKLFAPA